MQKFYKGRTNNHLTWVMVDATDFATPESALSAATKIKIYGKLRSGTGTNFVSSGTGSLTNDITHVGPSATGVYTIALAKADLSDASAAWYDQYIITLSATGAAYNTIVVDGGIDDSYMSDAASNLLSRITKAVANQSQLSDLHSDLRSYLVGMSGMLSDVDSAVSSQYSDLASKIGNVSVTITASDISDIASAVAAATGSDISDIYSLLSSLNSEFLSRVPKAVATNSQLSDIGSDLRSYLTGMSGMLSDTHSAAILAASHASDAHSAAVVARSYASDAHSAALLAASGASDAASAATILLSRITGAVASASDVASKVWAEKYTAASNVKASTFGSMMRLNMSRISDIDSALTSQYSDLASKIGNVSVTVGASDISDIASAVAAAIGSDVSDIYSLLSSLNSEFLSRVPKAVATNSQLSDVHSDLKSYMVGISGAVSDAHSAAVVARSYASDAHSAAVVARSYASDAHSAAVATQSMVSDIDSALTSQFAITSSMISDIDSALTSQYSDLASKVGNVSVAIGASDISDLASQVVEAIASATLDVNVVQVKGQTITGTGTASDPWGP